MLLLTKRSARCPSSAASARTSLGSLGRGSRLSDSDRSRMGSRPVLGPRPTHTSPRSYLFGQSRSSRSRSHRVSVAGGYSRVVLLVQQLATSAILPHNKPYVAYTKSILGDVPRFIHKALVDRHEGALHSTVDDCHEKQFQDAVSILHRQPAPSRGGAYL